MLRLAMLCTRFVFILFSMVLFYILWVWFSVFIWIFYFLLFFLFFIRIYRFFNDYDVVLGC